MPRLPKVIRPGKLIKDIALESLYETGIPIIYADGLGRQYYPIIAAMPVDYEEYIVMTGIKSL